MDEPGNGSTLNEPALSGAAIPQRGLVERNADAVDAAGRPISCPDCAAHMPETAAFCPGCGRGMDVVADQTPIPRASGKVGFLSERLAGALAYLTFIPAILFLVIDPYKKNRFVRFHSFQSLLLSGTAILIALTLKVAGLILLLLPVVGPLFVVLVLVLSGLAGMAIWLVLVVKALQGEAFQLPVLGSYAAQQAEAL